MSATSSLPPIDPGLVALTRLLVSTPSVNPKDTEDSAIAGEARHAAVLASYLRERGFAVETPSCEPSRPNVVASFGSEKPEHTIMIEGHLDTVSVSGMTVPPFDGEVRGDRLYGRGACDMKGPFAAALWALQPDVLEAFRRAKARLLVVGAIDEERGTLGARWLATQGVRADEAIVLEPTDLNLVLAHKNPAWLRIEVQGRAGHGSRPAEGVNAIEGMMAVLAGLKNFMRTLSSQHEHPLLGRPTLNVGRIQGGHGTNIIPDRCTAEVDIRLLPGMPSELVRDAVRARINCLQLAGVLTAGSVEISSTGSGFQTPPSARLPARLRAACAAEGRAPLDTGSPWFSDAGAFSTVCGEVVVFGPGSIAQAHTADEWIDLRELAAGSRILRRFLLATAAEWAV